MVAGLSGKERFRGWFLSIFTILSARRVSGVFIFGVFAVNVLKVFYCIAISSSITDVFCAKTLIYSALVVVLMSKELLPAFYCSSDVLYTYSCFFVIWSGF